MKQIPDLSTNYGFRTLARVAPLKKYVRQTVDPVSAETGPGLLQKTDQQGQTLDQTRSSLDQTRATLEKRRNRLECNE